MTLCAMVLLLMIENLYIFYLNLFNVISIDFYRLDGYFVCNWIYPLNEGHFVCVCVCLCNEMYSLLCFLTIWFTELLVVDYYGNVDVGLQYLDRDTQWRT